MTSISWRIRWIKSHGESKRFIDKISIMPFARHNYNQMAPNVINVTWKRDRDLLLGRSFDSRSQKDQETDFDVDEAKNLS